MAEVWNLVVATHFFFFGPGRAANLRLSLSNMRSESVEINAVSPTEFYAQPSLRSENGYMKAPENPSLGFEVDDEMVKSTLVTFNLHLHGICRGNSIGLVALSR